VLALAAGSALLLAPLVRRAGRSAGGRRRFRSPMGPAGLAAWCLGLVVLVAFPRDPVGATVTTTGDIHRWAAVAALSGLPVGALLTAVRHPGRRARAVVLGSTVCLVSLVPFVAAYLVGSPLRPFVGLLERLVALGEVGLLMLTARLPGRSDRRPTAPRAAPRRAAAGRLRWRRARTPTGSGAARDRRGSAPRPGGGPPRWSGGRPAGRAG
jgi:Protein of unknown function (DUF998)